MPTPSRFVLSHINQRCHITAAHADGSVTRIGIFATEEEARAHLEANYPGVTILPGGSGRGRKKDRRRKASSL